VQLNFTAFVDLANAVMGETLEPPFDPFKDDLSFLLGTYMFEDVGVSAYRVRVSVRAFLFITKKHTLITKILSIYLLI
jgi:hypothetical protein